MITILNQATPTDICTSTAQRMRQRRKELGLTQVELSKRADVSLGSLRRFETTGEISLHSLAKIAIVIDCEHDFNTLFAQRQYRSIQEIINEQSQ